MRKLLPCPFCGKQSQPNGDITHDEDCWLVLKFLIKTGSDPIMQAAWNRRVYPPNREIPSQPESPISGGLQPIADANVGNAKKTSNNEDRRRIEVPGCDGVDMMPIKDA